MDIYWNSYGNIMEITGNYHGTIIKYHGNVMEIFWNYHGNIG